MLNGATDYVLKNKLERLVPAIKRAMHEHELEINHKHAESALRESERKYKDLVNEVNDGYFVTNIQGIITFANLAMAKILGFTSPEELTGHSITEFNKISIQKESAYTFKNMIDNKKDVDEFEIELLRADGNSIHIEIDAIPVLENGVITGMQGVIHDITESKQAEIILKEKTSKLKRKMRSIFKSIKNLLFKTKRKKNGQ